MSEQRLTKRQEAWCKNMADPSIKTKKDAAIKAGHSPKSAQAISAENQRKPHLVERVETYRREGSDRARGLLKRTARFLDRLVAQLERIETKDLDLATLAALTRLISEIHTSLAKLAEYLGENQEESITDAEIKDYFARAHALMANVAAYVARHPERADALVERLRASAARLEAQAAGLGGVPAGPVGKAVFGVGG